MIVQWRTVKDKFVLLVNFLVLGCSHSAENHLKTSLLLLISSLEIIALRMLIVSHNHAARECVSGLLRTVDVIQMHNAMWVFIVKAEDAEI